MSSMQPEFEDEDPINPFDFWQGADFKIKIKKVAGYWNYDSSEFARAGTLGDLDDDELEAIWKKEYSLSEIVAPEQFKSYDDLKKRLDYVLGVRGTPKFQDQETLEEEQAFEAERSAPSAPADLKSELDNLSTDDDDTLSYFAKLAES
jgi:hypothetical protein